LTPLRKEGIQILRSSFEKKADGYLELLEMHLNFVWTLQWNPYWCQGRYDLLRRCRAVREILGVELDFVYGALLESRTPDWTSEQVESLWNEMNSPATKSFLCEVARRQGPAGYDYSELCAALGGKSEKQLTQLRGVITAASHRLGYEEEMQLPFVIQSTSWVEARNGKFKNLGVHLHEPWIHFIDRIEGRPERIEVELDDLASDKITQELSNRYETDVRMPTPRTLRGV
jgi:hypothetical protein